MNFYTVYLNRNSRYITSGTAKQCARALGMTRQSFYNVISRARRGAIEKYCIVARRAEDEL